VRRIRIGLPVCRVMLHWPDEVALPKKSNALPCRPKSEPNDNHGSQLFSDAFPICPPSMANEKNGRACTRQKNYEELQVAEDTEQRQRSRHRRPPARLPGTSPRQWSQPQHRGRRMHKNLPRQRARESADRAASGTRYAPSHTSPCHLARCEQRSNAQILLSDVASNSRTGG
jgi:hypothetical protein